MNLSIKMTNALALLSLIILISFSQATLALTVPETPPSSWNKGSFGVQTSSEYFFSHGNYSDTRGSYENLVSDNKWVSFENRAKIRYGFLDTVSLFAGVGGNAVTATSAGVDRSNSAATEVFAGLDFLLARRWWRVVPEVEVSYSLDQYKRGQFVPLTNNGASFANVGVFMFKPYRYLRFEGYLGFNFPGDDLAKKFMYSLATEAALFGAFTAGIGVQGYETIISDGTSNNERRFTQTTANATSGRFIAYNPALLEAKAWIGLRFDRSFGVRLGYAKTLNGVRTADGQSVLLSLFYNSPGQGTTKRASRRTDVGPAPVVPKAKTEFRTEPEPNDPELFDPADESLDNTERMFDK